MTSAIELSELMKRYIQQFNDYITKKDYDAAVELGLQVLEKLLKIANEEIIANLSDPNLVKIGEEVLKNYESAYSYAIGVRNALKYVSSPLYALGEKEQLVGLIASSVSELFNFIMGALLIVASLRRSVGEEGLGVV
ncbi:MAG: hypothetical protein ABWK01_00410 [Infirmifilum sp.]